VTLPKVYASIPTTGTVRMEMLSPLRRIWDDPRVELEHTTIREVPLEHSLAILARDFLAGGADYWLNMDDDNPPLENPLDLVFLDLDFVGCPTPVWKADHLPPIYWNAAREIDGSLRAVAPKTGLDRMHAHGGGCFLMSRRACRALVQSHGWEAFQREWDAEGRVVRGNDMAMTLRLHRMGLQVWTHWDYPCDHIKSVSLTDCYAAWTTYKAVASSTRTENSAAGVGA